MGLPLGATENAVVGSARTRIVNIGVNLNWVWADYRMRVALHPRNQIGRSLRNEQCRRTC